MPNIDVVRKSLLFWFLWTITGSPATSNAGDTPSISDICAASSNFVVRSYRGGPDASDVLQRARELRDELQRVWFGGAVNTNWNPRCEIVVHASQSTYLQVVGRGGIQTSGSSLVKFDRGRVVTRRVDLLADAKGELSALPHELTHVVLADRFGERQLPRWLDEGIATLSDSRHKQSLHHRDCRHALESGTAFRIPELFSLDRLTSSHQVAPFYGQSLSLVRFLADRDQPSQVIAFAESAMENGYDRALREVYEIDGVASLARQWRNYATSEKRTQLPGLLISTSR